MKEKDTLFRQATDEERDFYFKKLYPLQDEVLKIFGNQEFYLTGGTALSRFHYHHRFSDDLDFFYDGYAYPKEGFNFSYREIVYRFEKAFDQVEVTIDGEFFKRLFVNHRGISLKIEFIYENYKTVGEKETFEGVRVDSKENICANKIGTVLDRRTAKDFIDLFFLLNDINLNQAIKWSELKKVPPDYEGLMMALGDLIKNPVNLEGNVLTLNPLDEGKFIRFTKTLIEELFGNAKAK
jgi:predicted nucleotidyltransferase component of viral defense system